MTLFGIAVAVAIGLAAGREGDGAAAVPAGSERARLLVLEFEGSGVDDNALRTINALVAESLSRSPRFDVVSSRELQTLVAMEAEKDLLGCDTQSCLSELAGAMGASLVVFGNVGQLGKLTVVTMSLFDATKAKAVGRERVEAATLEELPRALDAGLARLVGDGPPAVVEPAAPAAPEGGGLFLPLLAGGAGAVVLGTAGAAAATIWGLALDQTLGTPKASPADKDAALAAAPLVFLGGGAGTLVALAGFGLVAAAFVVE